MFHSVFTHFDKYKWKKSLTDKPPLYDIHHIYIIDLPEKKRTNI